MTTEPDRAVPDSASSDSSSAGSSSAGAATPTVRDQLLAAALETATIHGITKLSIGDVARTAGLSRQTLYRYFPSKQALVAEVVSSETAKLIDQVVAAGMPFEDPRDSLEAGFLAALRATRDHPLLDRLVRTEPDALLPLLISDGGPVVNQVRSVVELIISARQPQLDPVALRRLADIVTRLLISYAVSAPDDPPEVVGHFVATFLLHGALPVDPDTASPTPDSRTAEVPT